MRVSEKVSYYGVPFIESVITFFRFTGHISSSFRDLLLRRLSISWFDLLLTVFRSGATMVLPLVMLSGLMSVSLVVNIYHTLSPYHLQHDILLFTQNILLFDILPFLISLILAIQSSLNLASAQIRELGQTPEDVIRKYIIPIMVGTNISALLLYIYCLNTLFICLYLCFRFLLKADIHEYLFYLTNTFTRNTIMYSIFKTTLYCTLVSLIVGYYYYDVSAGFVIIRRAMSKIITRSFIWLIVCSVYFKMLEY